MKRHTLVGVALLVTAVAVVGLSGGRAAPVAMPVPHPTVTDFQFITEHHAADRGALRVGRADVLHAAGDPVGLQRRAALRRRLRRHGHDDRHRRLVRQRHDGARPARLQPGVRPAADVRRGGRHLHARHADVHRALHSRVRRRPRRRRRRARAPGKRTSPPGRSRSRSTSRRRTRWRRWRTSCW